MDRGTVRKTHLKKIITVRETKNAAVEFGTVRYGSFYSGESLQLSQTKSPRVIWSKNAKFPSILKSQIHDFDLFKEKVKSGWFSEQVWMSVKSRHFMVMFFKFFAHQNSSKDWQTALKLKNSHLGCFFFKVYNHSSTLSISNFKLSNERKQIWRP